MKSSINSLLRKMHSVRDSGKYLNHSSKLSNFLFVYGTAIVAFLFFIDLFSAVIFLFHGNITTYALFISILCTVLYLFICTKVLSPLHWLTTSLIIAQLIIITFLGSFLISGHFFDLSYDGQAYHQEAIIRLKEGWNPVYKQFTNDEVPKVYIWINDYPKAAWIYESVFYKLTNHIEYAKAGNIALIAAALAIVGAVLLWLRFNTLVAIIVSFFIACNPVSIYQILTFYIDGQLASLFSIFLALSLLIFFKKNNFIFIPLTFSGILLANMKFTGFLYVGILYLGLITLLFINYKDKMAIKVILSGIVTLIFAGLILGFNPYITNSMTMGNPFYPAAGKSSLDLVTPNIPENYKRMNGAERFFVSAFAKSDSVKGQNTYAQEKLPFTVSLNELKAFTLTYATQGSYGPFYSGLLILSCIILFTNTFIRSLKYILYLSLKVFGNKNSMYVKRRYFTLPEYTLVTGILILLLLATILIVPVSSVARYVPQGFLIPLLVILYSFKTKSLWKKTVSIIMLYLLFLNTMLIITVYFNYNSEHTKILQNQLSELKNATSEKPITVYFDEFRSTRIRLTEANIHFNEVKKYHDCTGHLNFISDNISQLCEVNTTYLTKRE